MLKRAGILNPSSDSAVHPAIARPVDRSNQVKTAPVFRDLARVWFDRKVLGLSNGKHIQQNWNTLVTYVFPELGDVHADEIKMRHLIAVFDPVWRGKHQTAKRTLGRVREVFELAKLKEFFEMNPAEFDRNTAFGRVIKRTKHQPSLEWERATDLWKWLLPHDVAEDVRQMMMTMVLTGKRTKEVRMMEWDNIDRDRLIWTGQAEHMKMRREHRYRFASNLM